MILLQVVASRTTSKREPPGPARGDIVLTQDALPETIGEWKQMSFTPAPPPEELPEGQYWWVHQWQYANDKTSADDDLIKWHDGLRRDSSVETTERQSDEQNVIYRTPNDKTSAIVSFDQLGEDQWHELTYCYRRLDWMCHKRTEYEDADRGAYIVAELRNDSNEVALLVFSVFFEDGTWAVPPTVDLSRVFKGKQPKGVLQDVMNRISKTPTPPGIVVTSQSSGHTRALQCQVLVSNFNSDIPSEFDAAVQLHLASRNHFRSKWLASFLSQPH